MAKRTESGPPLSPWRVVYSDIIEGIDKADEAVLLEVRELLVARGLLARNDQRVLTPDVQPRRS